MALKPLNSVGGFSVGETPSNVILSNSYFIGNGANFAGNLIISNNNPAWGVLTDNLYYSNGQPWDMQQPGGSNTQIQFNDSDSFGGSANFTFDKSTNLFTVNGNSQFNNANLGNLATANFVNVSSNLNVTNTANVGNLRTDNLLYANGTAWDLGGNPGGSNTQVQYNDGTGNFAGSANFTYNDATQQLTLTGNANITNTLKTNQLQHTGIPGQQVVYSNGSSYLVGSANYTFNDTTNLLTVNGNSQFNNANLGNVATANFVNVASNTVTNNLTVNLTLTGNTANFSGNITAANANLGNLVTANFFQGDGSLLTNLTTGSSIASGNSNVSIPSANGNVNISVGGTANVLVVTTTGANLTGNLGVTGNTTTANLTVNLELQGNTANFDGNVVMDSWLTVSNTANVGNLRTDNLLYANGAPWDLGGTPGGSNTYVQYNDGTGNFGGSANFAFDYANNELELNGNVLLGGSQQNQIVNNSNTAVEIRGGWNNAASTAVNIVAGDYANSSNWGKLSIQGNVSGNSVGYAEANAFVFTNPGYGLGNVVKVDILNPAATSTTTGVIQANGGIGVAGNGYFGGNLSVTGNIANANNVSVTNALSANTGNFSGNLTSQNANLGNLATANFIDVASNLVTSNLTVNTSLTGNTANFSGNVVVPNLTVNLELAGNTANFTGNVVAANLIGTFANGNSNVRIFNNANIEFSSTGNANVVTITGTGLYVAGQIETTTGNVLANGNVTANGFLVGANANVTGEAVLGSVKTANITAPVGNITISATGVDKSINLAPTGNGVVDVANTKITNLKDPTADQDAATKKYVDDVAQGLNIHDSCYAATSNTLAILTGGTITYNNGTGGVGANLVLSGSPTKNFDSANTFDGNTTATTGSRILVKDEANAAHNGIYVVSNSTVLTRATDFNSVPEIEAGDFTFVTTGDNYNDTGWVQTSTVTTVGTDPITFTQFSGAGTYTAGSGLTLTGTVFSVNVDNVTTAISGGNVVVKSSANLTTPNLGDATFSSLSWNTLSNGNVSANNLSIGNLANVTGDLTVGGNIQANGTISSNANVSGANLTTTGVVSASANITGANLIANSTVFTANANVTGTTITNILTVNTAFTGNTANFSGNVIVPNLTVNLELAGNTANFSGNIAALNTNAGNLLTANFANIASNVTTSNLTVNLALSGNTANFTGNLTAANANLGNLVTANFFTGTLINGTSNVAIPSTNGNINLTAGGNTTLVVTPTGANITGNIDGSANLNLSSNLFANNVTSNNNVFVGNTAIRWATVTTSAITGNQTIATVATSGITGYEFIVKGEDSGGSKYSVATVTAVTDGTSVDYVTYATAALGGATGVLAVNVVGGNIALQVTPSSSNSTVWTTQYRTI